MLVKKASVYSICEFEEDGVLLQIHPTDILVARNWKVTSIIKDPEIGNTVKNQISILPSFGDENLPFAVISGQKSFSLINT